MGAGGVHQFADSQFGHLFASGPTRESARKSLVSALREVSIQGEIRTPVEYLVALLETQDFTSNALDTSWLDRVMVSGVTAERPEIDIAIVCGAVVKAWGDIEKVRNEFVESTSFGRAPVLTANPTKFKYDLLIQSCKYIVVVAALDDVSFEVRMNGSTVLAQIRTLSDGGHLIFADGRSFSVYTVTEPAGLRLTIEGRTCLIENEYDPSLLTAHISGKVVRFLTADLAHVAAGQAYAEMEVMKMYLSLVAKEPGVIRHRIAEGTVVTAGDIIATVALDDASAVKKASVSTRPFRAFSPPQLLSEKPHHTLRVCNRRVAALLNGLVDPSLATAPQVAALTSTLILTLRDPTLAALEISDVLTSVGSSMPSALLAVFKTVLAAPTPQPAHLLATLEEAVTSLKASDPTNPFLGRAPTLRDVLLRHADGPDALLAHVLAEHLRSFFAAERFFSGRLDRLEDATSAVVAALVDPVAVWSVVRAHNAMEARTVLVVEILKHVATDFLTPELTAVLGDVASLQGAPYVKVVALSRAIVSRSRGQPFLEHQRAIRDALANGGDLAALTESSWISVDGIVSLLADGEESRLRQQALELYLRRVHLAYFLSNLFTEIIDINGVSTLVGRWVYQAQADMSPRIHRNDSWSFDSSHMSSGFSRSGLFIFFSSVDQMLNLLYDALDTLAPSALARSSHGRPRHVLKIAVMDPAEDFADEAAALLAPLGERLADAGIDRVTFMGIKIGEAPEFYTFRASLGFSEDELYRHIDPPTAFQLELRRFEPNYSVEMCASHNRRIRVYLGKERHGAKLARIFARCVVVA